MGFHFIYTTSGHGIIVQFIFHLVNTPEFNIKYMKSSNVVFQLPSTNRIFKAGTMNHAY